MPIYYIEDEHMHLYAARGDLAPYRSSSYTKNAYWCITALLALADEELEQFPVTLWSIPVAMEDAVLRLLEFRQARVEQLSKEECLLRVKLLLEKRIENLNCNPNP